MVHIGNPEKPDSHWIHQELENPALEPFTVGLNHAYPVAWHSLRPDQRVSCD